MSDKRCIYGLSLLITTLVASFIVVWSLLLRRTLEREESKWIQTHFQYQEKLFTEPLDIHSNTSKLTFEENLRFDDSSTLIDLKNFKFIMNHHVCNKTHPFLVVMVHSAPANFHKRSVIRETWGQQSLLATTLFLIGMSDRYGHSLYEENRLYSDIIQGNFFDHYRNMTYKHVMALKWIAYHCPSKFLYHMHAQGVSMII